jgi:hypothetical protein
MEELYQSSQVVLFQSVNSSFSTGLIILLGSTVRFWWWCRHVNWSHYKVVAAEGVQWKPSSSTFKNTGLVVSAYVIAFLALAVWQIGRA